MTRTVVVVVAVWSFLGCGDPELPRPALSLDCLEPCRSSSGIYAEYDDRVWSALVGDTPFSYRQCDSTAHILVRPSFETELVVSVCDAGGTVYLYYGEAFQSIWDVNSLTIADDPSRIVQHWKDEPAEVDVLWRNAELDTRVWVRLQAVMETALGWAEQARPMDDYNLRFDGTTYRFFLQVGDHDRMCGEAWSPRNDSVPGQFVRIFEALGQLAAAETMMAKHAALSTIDEALVLLEP